MLDGKVAVVTGGGTGIGRAVSIGLAAAGAKVVVNDYGVSVDGRDPSSAPANEVVDVIRKAGGQGIASPESVATMAGGKAVIQTALKEFGGVRRRLEVRGVVGGITVYDDFAHHPTAIEVTLDGLRRRIGSSRLVAVLEPRSNTMKLGTHKQALVDSLRAADRVFVYQSPEVKWDVESAMAPLGALVHVDSDLARLTDALATEARPGDHLVLMSNGSFGGLHERLLAALEARNRA